METSSDRVKAAFQFIQTEMIPKGELWLGTDFLKIAGFDDHLDGHIKLISKLKQDIVCLPVAAEPFMNRILGYRYFPVGAIEQALNKTDFFVMAVIDGPFQRLVEKKGLVEILTAWVKQRNDFLTAYENERVKVEDLLDRCLEHPIHGIVIADDLAGDRSTFINPAHIDRFSSPFYTRAVSTIHEANAYALFHSCGGISDIVPLLLSCGFDGLAAIQTRTNDLISLKSRYGSRLVLMAGIDAELLEKDTFSSSDIEKFRMAAHRLARHGGFILSSSCGLYTGEFHERIRAIYNPAFSGV